MSFRFRKSLKLLPGVRLNIAKSGTSFSFGRRGASINIGHGKTRTSVGIPGTGMSYSQQLSGQEHSEEESPTRSSIGPVGLALIVAALIVLAIFLGV